MNHITPVTTKIEHANFIPPEGAPGSRAAAPQVASKERRGELLAQADKPHAALPLEAGQIRIHGDDPYFHLRDMMLAHALEQAGFRNCTDINLPDRHGMTPIMIAANEGDYELAKLLIQCGADVFKAGPQGKTALDFAFGSGFGSVACLLLDAGAARNLTLEQRWQYARAAADKGLDKVVLMLVRHGDDLDALDGKGWSPLMLAAAFNDIEIAKILMREGAHVDRPNPDSYWTPVNFAIEHGHAEMLELLLERDAKIGWNAEFKEHELLQAVRAGNLQIVSMLLDHHDLNIPPELPKNLVLLAMDQGNVEVAAQMLTKPGYWMAERDAQGRDLLMEAAIRAHDGLVQQLLPYCRDMERRDDDGLSAADLAAANGHADIVALLVAAGAEPPRSLPEPSAS